MAKWTMNNKDYIPNDNIRGIVYCMTYNNKKYIGKKVIRDKKGKLLNYDLYYGSSKHWNNFILGNEDKVIREVLFECANKIEMSFFEDYLISNTFAIWDDDYFNGNIGMLVNSRNSKNFHNMEYILTMINKKRTIEITL